MLSFARFFSLVLICFTLSLSLFISRNSPEGDSSSPAPNQVLTKRRLQDLLLEIDPREQMDDDVEDVSFFPPPSPPSLFLYYKVASKCGVLDTFKNYLQCWWVMLPNKAPRGSSVQAKNRQAACFFWLFIVRPIHRLAWGYDECKLAKFLFSAFLARQAWSTKDFILAQKVTTKNFALLQNKFRRFVLFGWRLQRLVTPFLSNFWRTFNPKIKPTSQY